VSVIADELHITIVLVVVRRYLSYHISTCSAGVAGRVPVRMYTLSVPQMAVTEPDVNDAGLFVADVSDWCPLS
jgi:hypothetical protein